MAAALGQLSEQERLGSRLFYHEACALNAIGEQLGATEARVSEIHTEASTVLHKVLVNGRRINF